MDTITKWDYMRVFAKDEDVRTLCHQGWEPVGIDDRQNIILKRPCGEISITKHPELWQSQNVAPDGMEY